MKANGSIATVLFVACFTVARPAFADVPPSCADFDSYMPCSKDDVGKTCSNGGTCYTITCSVSLSAGTTLYKCAACPPLVASGSDGGADAGAECATLGDIGKSCGVGNAGTCARTPSYCNLPALACVGPAPMLPPWDGGAAVDGGDQPPADGGQPTVPGGGASGGGCSCSLASLALRPLFALLSPLLLAVGTTALLLDRRRRRAR
jgi:hypothetical protein